MKCMDDALLQTYLDGECIPAESREISTHLACCTHCRNRLDVLNARSMAIKNHLDSLCTSTILIPPLAAPEPGRIINKVRFIRWVPLLGAACIALLFLVFHPKKTEKHITEPFLQYSCAGEMDGNKPLSEQPLSITVISPGGSISEQILR